MLQKLQNKVIANCGERVLLLQEIYDWFTDSPPESEADKEAIRQITQAPFKMLIACGHTGKRCRERKHQNCGINVSYGTDKPQKNNFYRRL